MKYFGCSDLPRSWKYAPTRTSRPFAPIAFAAISAMFAIARLCCHVPGASLAICFSSGMLEVGQLDQRGCAGSAPPRRSTRPARIAARRPPAAPPAADQTHADSDGERSSPSGNSAVFSATTVA